MGAFFIVAALIGARFFKRFFALFVLGVGFILFCLIRSS